MVKKPTYEELEQRLILEQEVLAQRLIRLQTLTYLNQLISSSLETDKVLSEIAEAAAKLMNTPIVTFWVADEVAQTLEVRAFSDEMMDADFRIREQPFGQGGVGWVAAQRQPLNIPDVFVDKRVMNLDWWQNRGLKSFFGFPIFLEHLLIGVLGLGSQEPFHFKPEDQTLLENFAAQAAIAIKNARLFEEVRKQTVKLEQINTELRREVIDRKQAEEALHQQNEYLLALHETSLGLINRLDMNELLEAIIERAALLAGTENGFIYLLDPGETEMKMRVGIGIYKDLVGYPAKLGDGLAGEVWKTAQPLLVDDYHSWEGRLSDKTLDVFRTIVGIPLKSGQQVVGVIGLAHVEEEGEKFTEKNVIVLSRFAELASIALDNAGLYENIRRELAERKRVEVALQKSEERYRTLFEDSRDGVFITTREGKFLDINQSFLDPFGYSREEMMEMNVSQLYVDSINRRKFQKAIEQNGFVRDYELRQRKKNGEEMECLLTATVRWADDGSILGYQGIVRDITEQRKLEAQLQQAQKMEAIGTLAGGVAHDLNNILSGIVSYPELMLMDLPKDSPFRKPILTIKKSGERATTIVQDLLTLARRGVAIAEVVNFNQIISEQLKSPEFKKLISFHPEVHVETNLERDLLNIKGSTAHLSKTVMNLISNAAEAMFGGGKIFISTKSQYVDKPIGTYDTVEEGDYVTLTVSDTGTGISPEDMGKIFEPFYTKKVMGRSGTGLGMAVVWGTVKDHKGYIDVQSAEGGGATFTLYFPVTREKSTREKRELPIEKYMGKGESILVVDDMEEQRIIASGMLKKLGYFVTTVSSGEEAVSYIKNDSADLLILDMIMDPGIDGLDTYKKILEINPEQKVIIASGFSETDRVKEAQRLGAGKYVKKPYTLEKIGLAAKEELGNNNFKL